MHGRLLHLLPPAPARVLDLGAGTGRDAAGLAARGYRVTAVEPVAELREPGRRLHAAAAIDWTDAALPELPGLAGEYDLVLATAVWMHLAPAERARAFARVLELLAPGATLLLTLRHGPVPPGRRMFEVPDQELLDQAAAAGLRPAHRGERADLHGRTGVRWSELGFVRD
ncbi:class I SAM-dependent methyltransferase [Kitasatospora viridis]|uniref:class I SAM-dependent methyltransferase n=1 Tax=Kitasatospora viridis TaxID=281105 RepID=UPI0024830C02|nr:class I SAM-dependent methyltransferase [Kitasatospora viridis]